MKIYIYISIYIYIYKRKKKSLARPRAGWAKTFVVVVLLASRHLEKKKSLFGMRTEYDPSAWVCAAEIVYCGISAAWFFPRDDRLCGLQVVPTRRICPCKPRLTGAICTTRTLTATICCDVRMFDDRTCECRADFLTHTLTWCNAREKWRTGRMRIN